MSGIILEPQHQQLCSQAIKLNRTPQPYSNSPLKGRRMASQKRVSILELFKWKMRLPLFGEIGLPKFQPLGVPLACCAPAPRSLHRRCASWRQDGPSRSREADGSGRKNNKKKKEEQRRNKEEEGIMRLTTITRRRGIMIRNALLVAKLAAAKLKLQPFDAWSRPVPNTYTVLACAAWAGNVFGVNDRIHVWLRIHPEPGRRTPEHRSFPYWQLPLNGSVLRRYPILAFQCNLPEVRVQPSSQKRGRAEPVFPAAGSPEFQGWAFSRVAAEQRPLHVPAEPQFDTRMNMAQFGGITTQKRNSQSDRTRKKL